MEFNGGEVTIQDDLNVGTSSKTTDTDVKLVNDNRTFGIRNDRAGSYFSIVDFNAGLNRFVVGSAGQIGIGGTNYGSAGQVLTSNGGVSAPSWQNASGGGSGVSVSDATALAFQCG